MKRAVSTRQSTLSQSKKQSALSIQHSAKTENSEKREPRPSRRRTPGVRFPEVEGKTLEWVELWLDDDDESYIELRFPDQTALLFVIQPYAGVNVETAYGGWKRGNWRRIG